MASQTLKNAPSVGETPMPKAMLRNALSKYISFQVAALIFSAGFIVGGVYVAVALVSTLVGQGKM
jgi:hypothetical protein